MTNSEPHASDTTPHRRDLILTLIAIFKFAKALLLIAIGLGALRVIRTDLREQANQLFDLIGQSVDVIPIFRILRGLGAISDNRLRLFGIGAFLYAALFLTEGVGLFAERRWAEYLTVVATASFIPFEIYELTRRLTWPRGGALLINIAVLVYLVWRLKYTEAEYQRRAERRRARSRSD